MDIVSGLYIVTLNNLEPISVNAHDKRKADKCIKVNKAHSKFGKAKDLEARKKNYIKTFGPINVNFRPFVKLIEIDLAEKLVLKKLDSHLIRGLTGKKNEWLSNITVEELEKIILTTLDNSMISYSKI